MIVTLAILRAPINRTLMVVPQVKSGRLLERALLSDVSLVTAVFRYQAGAVRHQLARLTAAVAKVTGVPGENVHVLVEPAARGRIAFGGQLVD